MVARSPPSSRSSAIPRNRLRLRVRVPHRSLLFAYLCFLRLDALHFAIFLVLTPFCDLYGCACVRLLFCVGSFLGGAKQRISRTSKHQELIRSSSKSCVSLTIHDDVRELSLSLIFSDIVSRDASRHEPCATNLRAA
jgi:hypothetical protein